MARTKNKPVAVQVAVPIEDRSYDVLVGAGMLARVGELVRRWHPRASRVALISDETVMPLYGGGVSESLRSAGLEVVELSVPAGERSKSPERLVALVESLVSGRLGRRDVVVALGGGVIGDLAGLTAALFMRGVGFVQCPTSLLAQVDASVGGKVAVDLGGAKNLLGAFHFPSGVIVDPNVLRTLPDREKSCGLAEMLKHGALFSVEHFRQVVDAADEIYAGNTDVLVRLVAASVALKGACVSRDPMEQGEAGRGRIVLNLGHTVGHAIEQISDFACKHGEAVALGLVAAGRISDREFRGPEVVAGQGSLEETLVDALLRLRLPVDLDAWLGDEFGGRLEQALVADKKRSFAHLSYIVLKAVGDPAVISLSAAEIVALLRQSPRGC